jgi:hypothetical protein
MGLGALVVVDRWGTSGEENEAATPSPRAASSGRVASVVDMIAALDAGDLVAASRYYAKDAVLTYPGGHVMGRDAITQFNIKTIVGNERRLQVIEPAIGYYTGYYEEVAAFIRTEGSLGESSVSLHTFMFRGRKILDHKVEASQLQCW